MELQDLQETADLAHLNMGKAELQGAFGAFEEMLSFFAAMQSADKDQAAFTAAILQNTEGAAASARMVNAAFFRPDTAASGGSSQPERILDQAGERDGRFIVIPNVL